MTAPATIGLDDRRRQLSRIAGSKSSRFPAPWRQLQENIVADGRNPKARGYPSLSHEQSIQGEAEIIAIE
jgi:hypothetical protein